MFPITQGEFTELVTAAELTLFETCTIYSKSGSQQDDYGQQSETYVTFYDVPCGVQAEGEREELRDQPIILTGNAMLRVKLGQTITVHDYVVVRGRSYEVEGVLPGLTLKKATLRLADLPEGI